MNIDKTFPLLECYMYQQGINQEEMFDQRDQNQRQKDHEDLINKNRLIIFGNLLHLVFRPLSVAPIQSVVVTIVIALVAVIIGGSRFIWPALGTVVASISLTVFVFKITNIDHYPVQDSAVNGKWWYKQKKFDNHLREFCLYTKLTEDSVMTMSKDELREIARELLVEIASEICRKQEAVLKSDDDKGRIMRLYNNFYTLGLVNGGGWGQFFKKTA